MIGKAKAVYRGLTRMGADRREKLTTEGAIGVIAVIGKAKEPKTIFPLRALRPLRLKGFVFQFSLFGNSGDFGNSSVCYISL